MYLSILPSLNQQPVLLPPFRSDFSSGFPAVFFDEQSTSGCRRPLTTSTAVSPSKSGTTWCCPQLVRAAQKHRRGHIVLVCRSFFCLMAIRDRVCLSVGLHQGMLNFDCTTCYVPLKTLAVGTLCKLCGVEPDVATLAMHLSLAPALLQLVYSNTSTVYLKVRVSRLPQRCVCFCVTLNSFGSLPQVLAPFRKQCD